MNKHICKIYAPVETFSGYGARSRDFVRSLIKLKGEEWDIKIISCRWGETPMNYLDIHNEKWGFLREYILKEPLTHQPDYMFWITIPSEAQIWGKYNILVTAGIESTICDPSWIEGINRMDLTLVSSEHSKNVFLNSKFDKQENGVKIGELKVEKPIEVLFEGCDLDIYRAFNPNKSFGVAGSVKTYKEEKQFDLSQIPEKFLFLTVGHYIGNAILGEDRKNIGLTIKAFLETFKNVQNPPALLLKTSGASASYIDRDNILRKYYNVKNTVQGKLPNVYILHGDLSDEEMNSLYNHPKVKAMVSLTKGEGYGRPLAEFSLVKKPIIASGWSGQLDFLNPEFTVLLKGQLHEIHPSAIVDKILIQGAKWFAPDFRDTQNYMKDIYKNYKKYQELAKRQSNFTKVNFSWNKMHQRLGEILENYIMVPKVVELKIPKITFPQKKTEKSITF